MCKDSTSYLIRIAESEEDLERTLSVRKAVFCDEQLVPLDLEIDQYETCSIHTLGLLEDTAIASGRVRFVDGYAKIERLAVLKPYRKRGFGNLMLKYLLSVAGERGFSRFQLHAQVVSESFYLKHGFKPEGEVFLEAGIPHRLMLKHQS